MTKTNEIAALVPVNAGEIAVYVDERGFMTRTVTKTRLNYGAELYCATRPGSEKETDKVQPYQPGYMKLVNAMGGQLFCPPTVRDEETGEPRRNPEVIEADSTGIIRRVKATAVCAVRNPVTGAPVVSVQTITYDTEHVLRQALMKIQDNESVRIMSQEEWDEEKGNLKGWSLIPLLPPYAMIASNMRMQSVREAWQTFLNQSATARQRACSKAERLAADHNPITRITTTFGELIPDVDPETNRVRGPSYIEVLTTAWSESSDRGRLSDIMERIEKLGQGAVSEQVELLTAPTIDVSVDEVDDEPETEEVAPAPHRVQRQPAYRQQAAAPEPARQAEPVQQTLAPAARSPELDKVLSRVMDLEAELSEAAVNRIRGEHGIPVDADAAVVGDVEKLRAYQSALFAAMEG